MEKSQTLMASQPVVRSWLKDSNERFLSLLRLVTSLGVLVVATLSISLASLLTLGHARSFNHAVQITFYARLILRVLGVKVRVHDRAAIDARTLSNPAVFIANHRSSLDILILCAIHLPRCRFFLTGLDRDNPQIAFVWLIAKQLGTFFTFPQTRPDLRQICFREASETLLRSGDNVFLTPEGVRRPDGTIGKFNKGAFHLAISLGRPIVPLYFYTPDTVNPGNGLRTGRGTVEIMVLPEIETSDWQVADVAANAAAVQKLYEDTRLKYC